MPLHNRKGITDVFPEEANAWNLERFSLGIIQIVITSDHYRTLAVIYGSQMRLVERRYVVASGFVGSKISSIYICSWIQFCPKNVM